jgi:hypothetical protein
LHLMSAPKNHLVASHLFFSGNLTTSRRGVNPSLIQRRPDHYRKGSSEEQDSAG